ncbi:hypothetical protein ACUS51_34390, partial [Pseudomonas aeruginosa]
MQKPVLIASAALICAAVIGIAVYATGSAKKDAGGFCGLPPVAGRPRPVWAGG